MWLKKHSSWIKLTVFLLLVLLVALSPLRKYLTIASLTSFVNQFRANPYAAFIYLSVYVAGVVLAVPGTALTILAAPLFGFWTGLLLVVIGSNLGCQITFFASRYLGKDMIQRRIKPGSFLEKASVKIEKNGFLFMLYIRLLPLFPFNVINYLSGLTTIRHRDYTLATLFGMLPGTLVYVYLSHTAADVKNNPYGLIVSISILLVFSAGVILLKKRHDQQEKSSQQKMENKMKYDFHIIVIGAGSAGLVVASGAAALGARVALIERDKMGGDCLNTGCVPSKSFLKCAHLAKNIRNAAAFGIDSQIGPVDLKKVKQRVHSVIDEIAPHDSAKRYEGLGVRVYHGEAQFVDEHHVRVGDKLMSGKNIVIATGSEPVVPNIKGLDEVPYLTNQNIFDLETLPSRLIVLGGGPIGLELGQGFQHLGSKVTVIDRNAHLFDKDDPEVAPVMENVFTDDGMTLLLKAKILEIRREPSEIIVIIEQEGLISEVRGDQLLVSLGRRPSTGGLNLEAAGIALDKRGYVKTDAYLRTNIKHIYACGDIAGPYQFTHMAGYQASVVIRNAIFHLRKKVDYSGVAWTTYTNPEVAHIGYTEDWGKKEGLFERSMIVDLADNDRAKAENDRHGLIKLNLGRKNRIIGATLVGEKAGEMIPVVSLAIAQKKTPSVFLGIIFSYPTEAESLRSLATSLLKSSFKPWQKKLVGRLFLK